MISATKKLAAEQAAAYRRGVLAAAALADDYATTHPFMVGDCIAMKLNATSRRRPRKNENAVAYREGHALYRGYATALAVVWVLTLNGPLVRRAARRLHVTVAGMREALTSSFTVDHLRKAGVR